MFTGLAGIVLSVWHSIFCGNSILWRWWERDGSKRLNHCVRSCCWLLVTLAIPCWESMITRGQWLVLHPAVGRLLRAWPLAQAGLGSVCPRSGHRQLHLRLPLHAPGGSAGPELRRLLLRLAAFRHPPAPPSPPGAGRAATGHLPLGLGADSRDRRARAGPAPRVRVCVRVGPEPRFGFGFATAPTQVMAPASAPAPTPAPAPASRRPLARSPARAPIPPSLGPSVPRSLTTRRLCEEGDGLGSRLGEGCLFGRRRSARPQRADWSGTSVPPQWQRREGGERERREGGRNLDVWDSGRPRERRLW